MNRVSGLFRAGVVTLLGASLSERTKRLIFLASFSARIKDPNTFDSETLHKLNQVMALASKEEAINLPVHLSRAIWRGRTIHDIADKEVLSSSTFTKERLQQLADRVLEAMPPWLRYGPDNVIRDDVARLLDHRSVLIGA